MILSLAQRSDRYTATTKQEREAVAGKTRSNHSNRRKHPKRQQPQNRVCVRPGDCAPEKPLPPATPIVARATAHKKEIKVMDYRTYGFRMNQKGEWVATPVVESSTKKSAAIIRNQFCSEMYGKDRIYKGAVTILHGKLYRFQTISSPVS